MRVSPSLLLISTRSSTNTASSTLSPPFPRSSMISLENISLAAERRPSSPMSLKPKQPRSTSSSSLLRSKSIGAFFTTRSEKPKIEATKKAPPPPPSFLLSSSPAKPKPTCTQSKPQPPPEPTSTRTQPSPSPTSNPFTNPPSTTSTSTPFTNPPSFLAPPPPPIPSCPDETSASSSLPLAESIALRLAYLFDPERILRERPKPGLSPRRVVNEGRSLTPLEAMIEKSRVRKWEREECRPVKG